tara:strand:+ start:631 stop:1614 length:984 start_codon:yes stop_codon:yes gene_type:complete
MTSLVGFENELKLLVDNYKSNSLHSSIILNGEKGIGKKTFINKFLNDIFINSLDGKNYLHHLNLLNNNTHPNVRIIERIFDNKSKKIKSNITIEQIRNLKKFVNESPSIKYLSKFIIIDSADDLNVNATNSLLKTLEEPKFNTFIFLISHQLSHLLPTIRSRCMKIRLNKHNFENFNLILKSQIKEINEDEIKFYYDLTNGSPGNAISLYDDNIYPILDSTLNSLKLKTIDNNTVDLANNLSKYENDKFKSYILLLKTILVTLSKLKVDNNETNDYLSNKFQTLKELSYALSMQNIIDRFEFLSNNENDLFTYNLDKKLFILKFLTI